MTNFVNVPVSPGKQDRPSRQPKHRPERYEGRHRATETKRSLGQKVLNLFRRPEHANANADTIVLPSSQLPIQENLLQKPKQFKLEYAYSGQVFDLNQNILGQPREATTGNRQSLLSEAEVAEQLGGRGFGSLEAVITLPVKQSHFIDDMGDRTIRIFCFKRDTEEGPRYQLMSPRQVNQVHSMFTAGHPSWNEISGGIVSLAPGQKHTIGRHHWLPDVGTDVELLKSDPALEAYYGSVSGEHAILEVDEQGTLNIHDTARYGTTVRVGDYISEALTAPTGEYTTVG